MFEAGGCRIRAKEGPGAKAKHLQAQCARLGPCLRAQVERIIEAIVGSEYRASGAVYCSLGILREVRLLQQIKYPPVKIDPRWSKLKAEMNANWPKPGDSSGEAMLLLGTYREVARLPESKNTGFAKHRDCVEADAGKLERALRTGESPRSRRVVCHLEGAVLTMPRWIS